MVTIPTIVYVTTSDYEIHPIRDVIESSALSWEKDKTKVKLIHIPTVETRVKNKFWFKTHVLSNILLNNYPNVSEGQKALMAQSSPTLFRPHGR